MGRWIFVKKYFFLFFACFFLIESISLLNEVFLQQSLWIFMAVFFVALFLSLYRLEYGVYFIIAELFVGGFGYLFSIEILKFRLSLRMALFAMLFLLWFLHRLRKPQEGGFFLQKEMKMVYGGLILIFIGALLRGVLKYPLYDVYVDANGWLFFLLILPFLDILREKRQFLIIFNLLFAAVLWLSIKTISVFLLFSQNGSFAGGGIYQWIRHTGVGEITDMGNNIYRIFFQSHIYVVIFVMLLGSLMVFEKRWSLRQAMVFVVAFYVLTLTLLMSQSRSFWIGSVSGFAVLCLVGWIQRFATLQRIVVFFSFLSIIVFSQFSLLSLMSQAEVLEIFSKRIGEASTGASGSSRINQLKPLLSKIQENWIFGSGFGTKVTYVSNDPRVREKHPDGQYTTTAFEWGYLDIILEMGIVGLIGILLLLGMLGGYFLSRKEPLSLGIFGSLAALAVVHMFTPYINHPLGIGYIIFLTVLQNRKITFI